MYRPSLYHGDLLENLHSLGLSESMHTTQAQMVARFCGFDYQPVESADPASEEKPDVDESAHSTAQDTDNDPQSEPATPRERLGFWALTRVEHFTIEQQEARQKVPDYITQAPPARNEDWQYANTPRRGRPLLPWSRLWPFLRRVLGRHRPGSRPDMPLVIRHMAEGRPLVHLPRQQRRVWNADAYVLVDRRSGLAPFWDDADDLIRRLRRLRGDCGLHVIPLRGSHGGLLNARTHRPFTGAAPPSSAAVLVLGDLGQYPATFFETQPWLGLGRHLRRRGIRPWALCPCPPERWSPDMARVWRLAAWDRHCRLPQHGEGQRAAPPAEADLSSRLDQRGQQLHGLLRLVSPAVRVERGLLRDIRLLLPSALSDVGTEYNAFQSADVSGSEAGFCLETGKLRELRAELGDTSKICLRLFRQVVLTLMEHHRYCQHVFGPEELDGLLANLPEPHLALLREAGLLTNASTQAIQDHWQRLAAGVWRGDYGAFSAPMAAYAMASLDKLPESDTANLGKQVLWAMNHPGPHRDLPAYVRPENIEWLQPSSPEGPLILHFPVFLGPTGLQIGPDQDYESSLFIDALPSAQDFVRITLGEQILERPWGKAAHLDAHMLRPHSRITLRSDRAVLELSKLPRPAWASRMEYRREGIHARALVDGVEHTFGWTLGGDDLWPKLDGGPLNQVGAWELFTDKPKWAEVFEIDTFGLRAEFNIRSVPFTLRWIPPGSFLMGSPKDEPGRRENEGPQHRVTISKGYWMAETPVTQAQWRAVVEEAGVRSNQGIATKLNPAPSHFKGPPDLPVESVSWEDSTTFCRLLNTLLPDGPGFHLPTEAQWEYACRAGTQTALYTGGIEILGENDAATLGPIAWYGVKSNVGERKTGTHWVKLKAPNPWGLYDTLGNVWEWCHDAYDEKAYAKRSHGAENTFVNESGAETRRVLRGGSWFSVARRCRAAHRGRDQASNRLNKQGLRLSAGYNEPQVAGQFEQEKPRSTKKRGRNFE